MSREFGNYHNTGYFHNKISGALEDLKEESRVDLHKKLIPLFEHLSEVAYSISSVEAGDSGQYRSILDLIGKLPEIKKCINQLDKELDHYRDLIKKVLEDEERSRDNK